MAAETEVADLIKEMNEVLDGIKKSEDRYAKLSKKLEDQFKEKAKTLETQVDLKIKTVDERLRRAEK